MKRLFLLLVLVSLSFACASTPEPVPSDIEVDAHADPKVNLEALKTYAWLGGVGALNDPTGRWSAPDVDFAEDTRFLIDRELRARGFTSTTETPDVYVVYVLAVDMEALKTVQEREEDQTRLENIPQAGLVIQLIDADTDKAVWTGAAVGEVLENPTKEESAARLEKAIVEVFAKYNTK